MSDDQPNELCTIEVRFRRKVHPEAQGLDRKNQRRAVADALYEELDDKGMVEEEGEPGIHRVTLPDEVPPEIIVAPKPGKYHTYVRIERDFLADVDEARLEEHDVSTPEAICHTLMGRTEVYLRDIFRAADHEIDGVPKEGEYHALACVLPNVLEDTRPTVAGVNIRPILEALTLCTATGTVLADDLGMIRRDADREAVGERAAWKELGRAADKLRRHADLGRIQNLLVHLTICATATTYDLKAKAKPVADELLAELCSRQERDTADLSQAAENAKDVLSVATVRADRLKKLVSG